MTTFWHIKIGDRVTTEAFRTRDAARAIIKTIKEGYRLLPDACPDIQAVAFVERENDKPERDLETVPEPKLPMHLGGGA